MPAEPPGPPVLVENVRVAPFLKAWVGGPDPERIPDHGRLRKGRRLKVLDAFPPELRTAPARVLKGAYLYGGPYYRHFGHVMTDSIARLWAYDPKVHTEGVVFAQYRKNWSPDPARFFREVLDAFGVPREKIVLIDDLTEVERLWFAEPGAVSEAGPRSWYLDRLATAEARLLARSTPDLQLADRIYLGRTHIARQGTFMGESFFAEVLHRNGYVSVRPEDLWVAEQVKLMRSARQVVLTEGSAAHIAEVMTPFSARVCMLLRRQGGEALFVPHLAPRCEFLAAGVRSDIRRLWIEDGRSGPSAPSYHVHPERTHADLIRMGMIAPEPFDADAYAAAERADAANYFAARPDLAEAQLSHVADVRKTAG